MKRVVRILAIGDVVGEEAAQWLACRLPQLRRAELLDWVIVNAENCTVTGPSPMNGFGLSESVVLSLLAAGADVVTGGNHSWDGPDVAAALALSRVVRPWNVSSSLGRGYVTVERDGVRLTVVNLLSPTAQLPDMKAPMPEPIWDAWMRLRSELPKSEIVVVDLHGESPWEKASFATAVDGEVTAVVGTHTHDPSLRGHLLPQGTAYVSELGMTGRLGFTGGGFDPAHFAADMRGEELHDLAPFALATGEMTVGAMLIEVGADGRAVAVERLQIP
ncbi:YmdB family metallophosphoesterase [Microbacterium sp. X-17]|uniref:YmdB family metallophosphoesterase n=1 Tax=Microbacterium sp. X-17 TaxID=3144404 RepID=UPI0031F4B5EC